MALTGWNQGLLTGPVRSQWNELRGPFPDGERGRRMTWRIACADDIGGRAEQQDRVASFADGDAALIVLADGLGGHGGGAQAAQAAVDAAQDLWQRETHPCADAARLLSQVCDAAHSRINGLRRGALRDPRSTIVALYVDDRTAAWAHSGDSRLYHFNGLSLRNRTRDHSMVQLLVDMQDVREDEMATHPDQSQLLQSLGGDDAPAPDFASHVLAAGDGFVLASDGLWETVPSEEMAAALAETDLTAAARRLVEDAKQRGGAGGDNVSLALARFEGAPARAPAGGGGGLPTWLWLGAAIAVALVFALFLRSPADDPLPPPEPTGAAPDGDEAAEREQPAAPQPQSPAKESDAAPVPADSPQPAAAPEAPPDAGAGGQPAPELAPPPAKGNRP